MFKIYSSNSLINLCYDVYAPSNCSDLDTPMKRHRNVTNPNIPPQILLSVHQALRTHLDIVYS